MRPVADSAAQPTAANIDIAADLEQHRSYLTRIARLQLRDHDLAEDVVQETMLAALSSRSFSGESSLRTWLTSILKHKVIDAIRRRQRLAEVQESIAEGEFDPSHDEFDSPFEASGGWAMKPAAWNNPEQALNQRQFFDVLAACMEQLPANTARVFAMREYLGLEVDEISRELAISAANVYVILYRARAALRQCLERKWFGNETIQRKIRRNPP